MVQLPRWLFCFYVLCGEYDGASDFVNWWGYVSIIGGFRYSFSGSLQCFFAFFEYSFDTVHISVCGGIHHFRLLRVECFRVSSIIGVGGGHPGG